ncbi:MAG: hypothetical protein WC712_11695 [Candidatus Brocadiia bacterium]
MKRLIFAICVLALIFTGCNEGTKPVATDSPQTTQPTVAATAAPSPSVAPELAVGDRAIIARLPKDIQTATFRQLWDVAELWRVGENIDAVNACRAELRRRGVSILKDVLADLPENGSGLEFEAFMDYFRSIGDAAIEPVGNLLFSENIQIRSDGLNMIYSLGSPAYIPWLHKALDDPTLKESAAPFLRAVARVSAYLGDKDVIPQLMAMIGNSEKEREKLQILSALSALKAESLAPFFIETCGAELISIRYISGRALAALGDFGLKAIVDAKPETLPIQQRRQLLEVVGWINTPAAVEVLKAWCNAPEWQVRFTVYRAFQYIQAADKAKPDAMKAEEERLNKQLVEINEKLGAANLTDKEKAELAKAKEDIAGKLALFPTKYAIVYVPEVKEFCAKLLFEEDDPRCRRELSRLLTEEIK